MIEPLNRMLKEAKANEEFNREAKEADPSGYYKPNFFAGEVEEIVYASVYYGWLIGKGRYKRSNYYY